MLRANWTAPADAFVLPGPDTNFVDITTPRVDEYAAVAAATAASVPCPVCLPGLREMHSLWRIPARIIRKN